MNNKQLEAAELLYKELGLNTESIEQDVNNDYLSINQARNGREVVWYVDDNKNGAMYVDNQVLLTNDEIEKELC